MTGHYYIYAMVVLKDTETVQIKWMITLTKRKTKNDEKRQEFIHFTLISEHRGTSTEIIRHFHAPQSHRLVDLSWSPSILQSASVQLTYCYAQITHGVSHILFHTRALRCNSRHERQPLNVASIHSYLLKVAQRTTHSSSTVMSYFLHCDDE